MPAQGGGSRADRRWGEGGAEGGAGDAGSRSGALQSDPTSPHPRAPGEGGPRGPPLASPTQTPASGVNTEGHRAPSPHPSPKCNPHCHNNKNLGHSSPGDEGDCPPTRTPQQQPSFPKLVQDAASRAAASSPTPRALPSLPVRKKASTSESAAPPSSAAPSGGFMTGGGRPRAAGGRRSLGPRAARRPVGGGRGAQRPRPQTRRTPGFKGGRPAGVAGLGQRTPRLPQAEARGGLGAPAAGSPMVPLPRGRWPPAVWPGPGYTERSLTLFPVIGKALYSNSDLCDSDTQNGSETGKWSLVV